MKTSRRILIVTAVYGIVVGATEARAAVYTVGNGWGCTHRTLAEAVAETERDVIPQRHVIRLTRSVSGAPTEVTLTGLLTIVGGYATCFAPEPSGQTALSGRIGGTRSILRIAGRRQSGRTAEINLHNLDLANGRAEEGGAILIEGGGAYVSMVNVSVHNSRATRGAGIAINGDPNGDTATTTLSMERTLVYDNEASDPLGQQGGQGGGVYCVGAEVYLNSGTAVSANRAYGGGGIDLHSCTLLTRVAGRGAGVFSNRADIGGGIRAVYSNLRFTSNAGGGLWVGLNEATVWGGGLDIGRSDLDARDLMLTDNRASEGGGLSASESHIRIYGTNGCTTARCPVIERNVATSHRGHALETFGKTETPYRLSLLNVHLRDNGDSTDGTIVLVGDIDLSVGGVVSQGNRASGLFNLIDSSRAVFEFVTSDDRALWSIFSAGPVGTMTVRGAIVAGNGFRPSVLAYPGRTRVECLLTHETASLPPGAQFVLAGNPLFVDRAAGNLRLQPFSPAIDFCDATGFVYAGERDADGRARGVDAPAGDRFGRFDLGAYEYQP